MKYIFIDYIWVSFIVIANILIFLRKGILTKYGYGFDLLDLSLDNRKKLKKIINNMKQCKKQKLYKLLNLAIPFLFVFALLLCIISVLIKTK